MIGIFLAKIKLFIRNPWTFVAMTAMSIVFALLLGGGKPDEITIPVYAADPNMKDSLVADMIHESETYSFNWTTKEEMDQKLESGKVELGVELEENNFKILVGIHSQNVDLIHQLFESAYIKKYQVEKLAELTSEDTSSKRDTEINQPLFEVQTNHFRGENAELYDNRLHTLFGFTLFFVIYTIAYQVFNILKEKKEGIWDRVILSPIRKWEMYVANFVYSFITGYIQVLIIFLVFRFVVGVEFHGRFIDTLIFVMPYVFTIVALSILLTGVARTVQQFNTIISIVAVSMAMIGGAYWPLEIVESKLMLTLSQFVPITYGMEVLNGIVLYGYQIGELLYPMSILILMGVAMTGIGIHLMERRHI